MLFPNRAILTRNSQGTNVPEFYSFPSCEESLNWSLNICIIAPAGLRNPLLFKTLDQDWDRGLETTL